MGHGFCELRLTTADCRGGHATGSASNGDKRSSAQGQYHLINSCSLALFTTLIREIYLTIVESIRQFPVYGTMRKGRTLLSLNARMYIG